MHFPLCRLHNLNIVYGFPAHCPLGAVNPCGELTRLKNAGFQQAGNGRGTATLAQVEICEQCVGAISGHPHIRHLRDRNQAERDAAERRAATTAFRRSVLS